MRPIQINGKGTVEMAKKDYAIIVFFVRNVWNGILFKRKLWWRDLHFF